MEVKMKKTISFLILLFVTFSLASCKIRHKGDKPSDTDTNTDTGNTPTVTIVSCGDVSREKIDALKSAVNEKTGAMVLTADSTTDVDGFEIVLGDTTRDISASVYKRLVRLTDDREGETAYVIYSKGDTIAIAYSDSYSQNIALDYLTENLLDGLFEHQDGILKEENVDLMKYLDEVREEQRAEDFAAVSAELGEETATELSKLYALYTEDIYIWLANLWDPDTGGFYYSGSGRNTVGYLPDLESTRQAFSYVSNTGLMNAYDDDFTNALSKETKEKIVSWVQSLQSVTDGYFYHPQWGMNIKDSRRGRDLNWATTLLKSLKAKPLYDTPNGMKGTLGAPGAVQSGLPERLGGGYVTAVSKVVISSTSGLPDYLRDTEKWVEYIEKLNIPTNSYSAGNTLSAMATQIKNAGKEYVDIIIDYLYEKQNPENGLWEDGVTYEAVNGLMKLSEAMATLGYPINNMEKALESAIEVALLPEMTPESNKHVCSVYNPWVAMNSILSSAEEISGKPYAESLRAQIIEKAPELIAATREKIAIFRKDDGGFSYLEERSAHNSQGAAVAVPYTAESDVNATGISSNGIASNICSALGIEKIDLFTAEDGEYFLSLFNSFGTIIKDPEEPFDGPTERVATFTDGVYDTLYVRSYFGLTSSTSVSVNQYDEELEGGFDPITNYDIVADPTNPDNKVLRVICEKSKEYVNGTTKASVANKNPSGNCYTVEFKAYYTDILEKGDVTQLHFTSGKDTVMSLRLCADSSRKNLTVIEYNNTGSGSATVSGFTIPTGEWVTIRIEYYVTSTAETTMAKIYVGTDGNEPICMADVNAYRDIALDESKEITEVRIAHQRTNGSTVYLDDISLTQTEKEYAPIPPKDKVATFENGETPMDYVTSTMANGDITVISIDRDPTDETNTVLKVAGKSGGVSGTNTLVELSNEEVAGNSYAFETKLYFTGLSKTLKEDIVQIYLNDSSSGKVQRAMGFAFKGSSDAKTVGLVGRNNVTGGTGNSEIKGFDGKAVTFAADTWYTFRIEYYATGDAASTMSKIYVAKEGEELTCVAEVNMYRDATLTDVSAVDMQWQKWDTEYTVYADDISLLVSDTAFVSEESKYADDTNYSPTADLLSAKGGATGIITLMHDDGYLDSAMAFDKILYNRGLVADVGMIADRTASPEYVKSWQALLDTGRWNIVSHSMTHTWWGIEPSDGIYTNLTDDTEKVISEFIESQALLREKFPTQRVLTFAWPGFSNVYNKYVDKENGVTLDKVMKYIDSDYVKSVVDEYYVSGRKAESYAASIEDGGVDWSYMPASIHISEGNIDTVLSTIDDAAKNGKFCVLYTHKIIEAAEGETVSGTGTYIASYYMDDVCERVAERVSEGTVWNTYYEDAVLYIREYQSSSVSIEGDTSSLKVNLTDTLDNGIYNYPLTVKIGVPYAWEAAKIVQGDHILYAKVVKNGLKKAILADIVPDGGEAIITPCALSDVPAEDTAEPIPTPEFTATKSDFEGENDATFDSVTGDVIAPDKYVSNTFASTDLNETGNGYKYISCSLTNDPALAANRVLKVQVTEGGGSSSRTDVALQSVDPSGVCYVFEGKFYYGKEFTDGTEITEIAFKEIDSNKYIYSVYLKSVSDSNGNYTVRIVDNNKTYGIGTMATLVNNISVEKWFELKIEFWRTKSADTTVAKIYIDGVCVAEDRSYRNNALINWELNSVGISHMRYNSHTVYMDDVCLSQISKTYEKTDFGDDSDTPESSVSEGFDLGNITSGNVTTNASSPNTAITVDKDPTDSTNNVLKVVQENSSSSSNSETLIALSNPDATGNCYTFEAKIYFTGMDASTSAQDIIQMYFTGENTANRTVGFGFKENANADKIYFSARNNVTGGTGNTSISNFDGTGTNILANKWYTLRYELYATGDAATTMTKIYIGEVDSEPVCVAEANIYRDTSITDIRYFRMVWQKYATEYTVYLDDVSLVRSDRTFVSDAPAG